MNRHPSMVIKNMLHHLEPFSLSLNLSSVPLGQVVYLLCASATLSVKWEG